MRLDKFLKVSRLIKRRTVAAEACDAGRVSVNGQAAKAGKEIKVGDTIAISFGDKSWPSMKRRRRKMRIRCLSTSDEYSDIFYNLLLTIGAGFPIMSV